MSQSTTSTPPPLDTVFDLILAGGWLMLPIALCSIIALAIIVERSIRMRTGRLGSKGFGEQLVAAVRKDGPTRGLALCREHETAQARVLAAGLRRVEAPWAEREKAVEDAGARETQRMSASLRPLVVIGTIAPLLGLLGTVWGMVDAFRNIALGEGQGKPEALASGISLALITTVAGLVVAIPAQAAYYWFRSRIDRFVRLTEDVYDEVSDALRAQGGKASA